MHVLPRSASGMAVSTSGGMAAVMHQQLCAGRPAATAHWLGCPHKGQTAVVGWVLGRMLVAVYVRQGAEKRHSEECPYMSQIGLQRLSDKRW